MTYGIEFAPAMWKWRLKGKALNNSYHKVRIGGIVVEMYERGQIVLPKYVRDMLNLHPGSKFSIKVDERRIILEPEETSLDGFRKICSSMKKMSGEEVDAMIKEAREKRQKEWLDVPGL